MKTRVAFFFFSFLGLLFPFFAHAFDFFKNSGIGDTAKAAGFSISFSSPLSIIYLAVRAILGLVGVLFFLLIFYGGFLWFQSRGNKEDVEKAKKIIKESVIGVIIAAAAYIFTYFIFSQFIPAGAAV